MPLPISLQQDGVELVINADSTVGATWQYATVTLDGFWLLKGASVLNWNSEILEGARLWLRREPTGIFKRLKSGEASNLMDTSWSGTLYLEGEWSILGGVRKCVLNENTVHYLRVVAEKLHPGRGL